MAQLFEPVGVVITPSSPCVANPHDAWEVELGVAARLWKAHLLQARSPRRGVSPSGPAGVGGRDALAADPDWPQPRPG